MIKPEMIPDVSVEAAARAIGEYYTSKEWFEIARGSRDVWHNAARAALSAALAAWPGVDYRPGAQVTKTWRDPGKIILPLPQEKSDGRD